MSKAYKRIILLITIAVFILSACSTITANKKWYDKYNVETETETISLAKLKTNPNADDYISVIVEVTDEDMINQLKEGLKLELWEKARDKLKEEPTHYMILNSQTMIVLYSGYGQCRIFNYKIVNGKYVKSDYSEIYIMNKDVFPIVKKLINNNITKS